MVAKLISVTSLATSVPFKLSSSMIVSFFAVNAGANTKITYISDYQNTLKAPVVSEAAAAIDALTGVTIPVTVINSAGTGTLYINVAFISSVSPSGTGAVIKFDSKKTEFDNLVVTETPAAIQALVNAL
jgi:hypothetical protein